MANPHAKCEICRLRHRPGNCRPDGGGRGAGQAQGNQCHSLPGIIADLDRICGELASLVGKLPCASKQEIPPEGEAQ
jgi:hypothetical protein